MAVEKSEAAKESKEYRWLKGWPVEENACDLRFGRLAHWCIRATDAIRRISTFAQLNGLLPGSASYSFLCEIDLNK